MALNHSPSIVTNGLAFYYDMSNPQKSWRGRPVTNNFILPTVDVNGFNVQNDTFTRVRSGNYGGYDITGNDYVWRFDFTSSSTCPYHGNDTTVITGVNYTFSFDYYVSPDAPAGGYGTRNLTLATFEQAISGSVSDTTPAVVGVWKRAIFTGTTGSTNLRALLYPGGCFTAGMSSSGFILFKNPQVEASAPGNNPSPFVAGTRFANNNLETTPSFPTWNATAGSTASGGTLTFSGGSYNSKGSWDLYKTYSGLSTATNYTWSALVKLGTATNFIVTMNNTQDWNTGPGTNITNLSTFEYRRVFITGTTSSGSFNLHLGASFNSDLASTSQTAGTVFIQDVRLELTNSQSSIVDLTGNNTVTATSLTYASDGTFSFNGTSNYCEFPLVQTFPNNFTVEAWIYSTEHSSDTNIGKQIVLAYSNLNGWIFSLNGPLSYLQLRHHNQNNNALGYNLLSSTGLSLNTWHHIAATDNGTTVSLFVNGTSVASMNSVAATTNGTIAAAIGAWPGTGSATHFKGNIPIIKLYNRGLSTAEVQQNFNAQRVRYGI
jgi:hypothetical protein